MSSQQTGTAPSLRPWSHHLSDPGIPAMDDHPAGTLPGAWAARWAGAPDALALLDAGDPSTVPSPAGTAHQAGRWWNGGELDAATRLAAGRWATAGLRAGDRVLWSTGSSVASLVAHIGALRAGLVVVPVTTGYTEREIAYIVSDVRPAAVVTDDASRGRWARQASERPLVVVGPELDLPDGDPGPVDAAAPDDPALICFTSGTTGAPKGAVLRHRNLLAATESVRAAWRWTAEDRLVHSLPVFHAHGLCVGVYGTLLAGGSAVLLPGFDPAAVVDAAVSYRASLFFGVPTMYHRLMRSGRAGDLGGLRLCVSGSAPLVAALHGAVSGAIGMPVLERYGMTETLMNVSNPYHGVRKPGTVGFPLPRVEVELAPDGEILLRGPNVFDGYWERPAATADAFEAAADGGAPWFRSGDLGTVDDDGYLTIRGRSKELIISGGFNVYPSEVEDVLAACPGIDEVAVTGTPSDEWGEVVTAWIVADGSPPSLTELAAFATDRLAAYKRPRVLHVIDALPRNALGKVVRSELIP